MGEIDEDPLDLLEDDGDGVIDTILFLDEEEKRIEERTGCAVLILGVSSSAGLGLWVISKYFVA